MKTSIPFPRSAYRLCTALLLTVLNILPTLSDSLYLGGPYPFLPLTDSTVLTINNGETISIQIPGKSTHSINTTLLLTSPDTRQASSGLTFILTNTDLNTLSISLKYDSSKDQIYDNDKLILSLKTNEASFSIPLECTPSAFRAGSDAVFSLRTDPTSEPPSISIYGGREMQPLWQSGNEQPEVAKFLSYPSPPLTHFGIHAPLDSRLTVKRLSILTSSNDIDTLNLLSTEDIKAAVSASDASPYAGYWTLLDYDLDDAYLRPGGDYLLAFVPTDNNGYDIIYLEGATIKPDSWRSGRKKGTLYPTRLSGLYRVSWNDAEGLPLDKTATLQFNGTDMLTLTFPSLRSSLRFHRVPPP